MSYNYFVILFPLLVKRPLLRCSFLFEVRYQLSNVVLKQYNLRIFRVKILLGQYQNNLFNYFTCVFDQALPYQPTSSSSLTGQSRMDCATDLSVNPSDNMKQANKLNAEYKLAYQVGLLFGIVGNGETCSLVLYVCSAEGQISIIFNMLGFQSQNFIECSDSSSINICLLHNL